MDTKTRALRVASRFLAHEEYNEVVSALEEDDIVDAQRVIVGVVGNELYRGRMTEAQSLEIYAELDLTLREVAEIREAFNLG